MSLTINLSESEMAALERISQTLGCEPADCAAQIITSHLDLLRRTGQIGRVNASNGLVSPRPSAHTLQGKYSHLNVSTETLRKNREEEIALEEAKFQRHFGNVENAP